MEFTIIAYDGQDEDAVSRRMAVREAHIQSVDSVREFMIHGGAILDDAGKMIGSIIITNFPSREALDTWLQQEPYVLHNIWQNIQILPYKTGPSFVGNIPKPKLVNQI